MATAGAWIKVAACNQYFFSNTSSNDLIIYTGLPTQKILFGTSNTTTSALTLTSNTIITGANIIPYSNYTYSLGTSNLRFKDLFLGSNSLYLGNTKFSCDSSGTVSLTDYITGSNQAITVQQIQLGSASNSVILTYNSNNNQLVLNTYSNGSLTGQASASSGGWSNTSSNVYIIGSNVGIGKSNPVYPLDITGDLNFTGTLRQGGLPYVGSQWSNNSSNVFLFGSNVGIGRSNPQYPLDINGDIGIRGNINLQNKTMTFGGVVIVPESNNIGNVTTTITGIPGFSNTSFGGAQLGTVSGSNVTTGSNASALSNIIDASGTWATLCNIGTINVVNNVPNSYYNSNASIDTNRGYFQFSNNGSSFASSNIAHPNIITTSFTIESWIYYYNNPVQALNTFPFFPISLIGQMSPVTTTLAWGFGITSNMQLSFVCRANANTNCGVYTQSNTIPLNTWTHVGMSYTNNNSNLQLFVNGIPQSNLIVVAPWLTSNASSILAYQTSISSASNNPLNVIVGQYNNSNNPCYVHDLRMTTGVAYTPSNPPIVPLSTPVGTRLLLRGGQVNLSAYNPISIVPNGCIGVNNSNPLYNLDIAGNIRVSGDIMNTKACFCATMSGATTVTTNNIIIFNYALYDLTSNYNTTTGQFTATRAGYYFFTGCVNNYANNTGGGEQIQLRRNATAFSLAGLDAGGGNINVNGSVQLNVNDKVDLYTTGTMTLYIAPTLQFSGFMIAPM